MLLARPRLIQPNDPPWPTWHDGVEPPHEPSVISRHYVRGTDESAESRPSHRGYAKPVLGKPVDFVSIDDGGLALRLTRIACPDGREFVRNSSSIVNSLR